MNDFTSINTKKCLICKNGGKNNCLHWHHDKDTNAIWVWCQGKCKRGYSIYEYCAQAGLSLRDFLKSDFDFEEARPNEVQKMEWPAWFLPLFDPRAKEGINYVCARGLNADVGDMYYDSDSRGIVFPYYFDSAFVGAQIRFIETKVDADGEIHKIDTIPGTRLGLLFYNFNQSPLPSTIKCVVVCEGAFNALSLTQALNAVYGGANSNPYRCVATSGCSLTEHHSEVLKELKEQGRKIVLAYDYDEAGRKGIKKAIERQCISHVAFTGVEGKDWNDLLKDLGNEGLAKFFLKVIRPV